MTGGKLGASAVSFRGLPLPRFTGAGGNTNADAAKSASCCVTTGAPLFERVERFESEREGEGAKNEGCLDTGGGDAND